MRMESRPARVVALVVGTVALVASALVAYAVDQQGFPDGHLTTYGRASRLPRLVLGGLTAVASVALLTLAWRRHTSTSVAVAMMVLAVLVALQWLGVPYWFLGVQGLDDGQGG